MVDHRTTSAVRIAVTLLVVGAAGCGSDDRPTFMAELVPVSGVVTRRGTPVVGATVTYHPAKGSDGEVALGVTDANGRYRLRTMTSSSVEEESVGGVPGDYVVTVSRIAFPDGSLVPDGTTEADAMSEGAGETLPDEYSSIGLTTLKATIRRGETGNDFALE